MPLDNNREYTIRRATGLSARYLVLLLGAVIVAFPFLWMVLTSFKGPSEVFSYSFKLLPSKWIFSNYAEVFDYIPFTTMYANSIIVAVVITTSQLLTCAMAAYAFARLKFPGREVLFYIYLATMMLPEQVRIIPSFLLLKWMHIIDGFINVSCCRTMSAERKGGCNAR